MTDKELTTRIAMIAAEHRNIDYDGFNCNCGHKSSHDFPRWADHLAETLITELKLHPVETLDRRYVRWVTQWRNNTDPTTTATYCLRCGIPHTTPCRRPNHA